MTFLICTWALAYAKNGTNVYEINVRRPDLFAALVRRP